LPVASIGDAAKKLRDIQRGCTLYRGAQIRRQHPAGQKG